MAIIKWTEDCSVNIAELDAQHRDMIGIINRLYDSIKAGQEEQHLSRFIKELSDHAVSHFALEEGIMAKYSYPKLEEHKKAHQYIAEQLNRIKTDHEKGESGMGMALLLLLRGWLIKHIKEVDKDYSQYLNSKGVA